MQGVLRLVHQKLAFYLYNGAPAAQGAAKRSTITIETEPHSCIEIEAFFMANMASDMARGRVRPTTTTNDNDDDPKRGTESPIMAPDYSYFSAMLQRCVPQN